MKNYSKISKFDTVLKWGSTDHFCGISVIVSLYNYSHYLEECLTSIYMQDYSDIQLIVVDDSSRADNSLDVASIWMMQHRFRFHSGYLLRHHDNFGLAEARNTGFEMASHDKIFVMDADNVILPSCLRKLSRALSSSGSDAAYSQLVMFGDVVEIGCADYWLKAFLSKGPYIDAMSLINKCAWQRVGGYTHLDGGWEDYDFWCKLMEQGGNACYVPELLCRYRVHASSMLRADAAKNYTRLFNTISLRHPWTRLA